MRLKKLYLLLLLLLLITPAKSDTEYSFYAGTFDLIDKEGDDKATLYGFLREKYGDWIVYDPRLNKNTYILWILPLLLFLLGGAIMLKKLKFKN